ncbi:TPR-like protein [Basidiobolus meristosporus CBS 931.73]|uniref:TPR-like protein n=1 Tax=Basidiobolus meristosporus CBS 931.73 TaxID=1314790 RepID=A0A1Y1YCL4_9FUNG|nr:TPR-like protein [Basidiobolus meristosporus CBS 931.73]|eukprot:ORX95770.1 TPR-like protein [Basidiobolus meristosporus CBS 931.73]
MSLLNRARLLLNGLTRANLSRNASYGLPAKTSSRRYFSFYPPAYIIKISPIVKPKARSALLSSISPLHNFEQAVKAKNPENAWSSFTRILITPNEKLISSTHISGLLDILLSSKNKKLTHERCVALLSHMKRLRTSFQTVREHFPLVRFYLFFGYKEELVNLIRVLTEKFSFSEKECSQLIYQFGSVDVRQAWTFYQHVNPILILGEQPLLDLLSFALKNNDGVIIDEIGDYVFTSEAEPSRPVYQALVQAYTNCCTLDSVLKLYHKADNSDLLNIRVFNMFITFFRKAMRYDLCIHMYNELTRRHITPDIVTLTSMMQVYARKLDIQSAEAMLKKLFKEGLSPDVMTYTTLIGMYAKASKMDKAYDLISEMKKNGVSPTLRTYTALLNGCSISNDVDGAMKIFRQMEASGVQPDITAYNTLLRAYSKHPNDDEIQKILAEMIERKCNPNSGTYSLLAHYYLEHGDEDRIDELESKLLDGGHVDELACHTLVDTYLALSNWSRAIKVYEIMKSRNLGPLTDIYNAILKSLANESEESPLLKFFHEGGSTQNIVSFNIILNYFRLHDKVKELQESYESMVRSGVRGDLTTYNILISAYCNVGDLNKALNVFDSLESKGTQPDRRIFNTLLSACFKHNESNLAFSIYQAMLDQKLTPDQHTLTILMDHYNRIGEMENVFRIWELLTRDFPKETLNTSVSVLLDSLGFNGNLDTLKHMWEKLRADGYMLDENNFSSYIEALCRFGAHDDAIKVLMHEMESIQPSRKTCELLLKSLVSYRRKEDVVEVMNFLRTKSPEIYSVLAKIL